MNDEKPAVSQDAFHRHLERVSRSVAKWPKWKQELLGGKATVSRKTYTEPKTMRELIQKHADGDFFEDSEKERVSVAKYALLLLDVADAAEKFVDGSARSMRTLVLAINKLQLAKELYDATTKTNSI